jgi:penicillin-binding protein 2
VHDHVPLQKKAYFLLYLVLFSFLILVIRLGELQIWQKGKYQLLARQNYLRLIPLPAPRGRIYDRDGKTLASNDASFNVELFYRDLYNEKQELQKISGLLKIDPQKIAALIQKAKENNKLYLPIRLASGVGLKTVNQIEENKNELPGIFVNPVPRRKYPFGALLAQVLGYVQEITSQELAAHQNEGYLPGDLYGQAGLENSFEESLRGHNGAREVEVDAAGHPVRDRGVTPPTPGNDLQLTVSAKLQAVAEKSLQDALQKVRARGFKDARGGAAVVECVYNGQILAMASVPSVDPRIFTGSLSSGQAQKIFTDPDHPFLNRTLLPYAPGSTFKPVVATAALEAGIIKPDTTLNDPGYFRLGSQVFHNWFPAGFGWLNVTKALQVSSDTFFWKLGESLGWEPIARWAEEYGFGQKTGIELPEEMPGVVPTPAYKEKMVKSSLDRLPEIKAIEDKYAYLLSKAGSDAERQRLLAERDRAKEKIYAQHAWELNWQEYDTINMAIGQGYVLCTPLQLACYVSAIANGGTLYKPYLVQKIISPEGFPVKQFSPQVTRSVPVSKTTLETIRKGMSLVTQGRGTAASAFAGFPVPVAGKTGTAETSGKDSNALFICYAPVEKPEVAVAVVVEHAGEGAVAAAPVARAILSAYFGIHN